MGLTFQKEEAQDRPELEEEQKFLAVVKAIEGKDKTANNGDKYRQIEWKFELSDPDGDQDERTIYGKTSDKFVDHPDCKLKNWTEAILGEILPIDERVDMDDVLDRECIAVIGVRMYTKDGDIEENTRRYEFVKDVRPTKANAEKMKAQLLDEEEPF